MPNNHNYEYLSLVEHNELGIETVIEQMEGIARKDATQVNWSQSGSSDGHFYLSTAGNKGK